MKACFSLLSCSPVPTCALRMTETCQVHLVLLPATAMHSRHSRCGTQGVGTPSMCPGPLQVWA